jgi:lysozyme family protein/peptidoglycan hydrolase-like protein with peptidoglycan-binding domain
MPGQTRRTEPSTEVTPAAPETNTPEPLWEGLDPAMGNAAMLARLGLASGVDEGTAAGLLDGTVAPDTLVATPTAGPDVTLPAADVAPTAGSTPQLAAPAPDVAPTVAPAPRPAPQAPTGTYRRPYREHERQVAAARTTLSPGQANELRIFQANYHKNFARYQAVSARTDIPPQLVAAIHYRESSMNFNTYLHQGDPLGRKAVHVPRNIPIFYEWEEAAVHALNMKRGLRDQMGLTADSTDEVAMATYAEAYNGLGYYHKGLNSPYVYAGTDQYQGGMYVADGKFSRRARDRRLGTLALTRSVTFEGPIEAPQVEDGRRADDRWRGVLAGQILYRGSDGGEVVALQQRLTKAGFPVPNTGIFGAQTFRAVKEFQRSKGLPPDGVVGPDTAEALDRATTTPAAPATTPAAPSATEAPASAPVTATPAPDTSAGAEAPPQVAASNPELARVLSGALSVSRGASGAVVRAIQELLGSKGERVDVDGDFGPRTDAAIRRFQQRNGLRADGVVGERTAGKLIA